MWYYALVCALIGAVVALLNVAEGSSVAIGMSWLLLLMGVALVAIDVVWMRSGPVRSFKTVGYGE
jgi:hypothetical protein